MSCRREPDRRSDRLTAGQASSGTQFRRLLRAELFLCASFCKNSQVGGQLLDATLFRRVLERTILRKSLVRLRN